MSLRIFLKIKHVPGQKMIDPPSITDQDLIYNLVNIQHVHGQKMTDPTYHRPGSHLEFFTDSTCA